MKLKPSRWAAHGSPPHILSLLNGINFIWRKTPPKTTDLPNHSSYTSVQSLADTQLQDNIKSGIIELQSAYFPNYSPYQPHPDFVYTINPLGSTSKKDSNEVRPYTDPSITGINDAMAPLPLHLPTIESLITFLTLGHVIAKRDWRHGFHHAILAILSRMYMGIRLGNGLIARFVALPFGAS